MKQLKDAFADSINRAEKTLRRQSAGKIEPTKKERGHVVTKLSKARAKKRTEKARQIVCDVQCLGLDDETLAKIETAAKAHAQDPEQWVFIMLSAQQNAAVVRWINQNSKRPHKAVELWATVLEHLRMDTGEIMATRQELAQRVGTEPRIISSIITELASINAIRREKDGRRVKYFLNANIATHLGGASARAAARDKAGPLMQVVESGRDVVDDDMDVIDE